MGNLFLSPNPSHVVVAKRGRIRETLRHHLGDMVTAWKLYEASPRQCRQSTNNLNVNNNMMASWARLRVIYFLILVTCRNSKSEMGAKDVRPPFL